MQNAGWGKKKKGEKQRKCGRNASKQIDKVNTWQKEKLQHLSSYLQRTNLNTLHQAECFIFLGAAWSYKLGEFIKNNTFNSLIYYFYVPSIKPMLSNYLKNIILLILFIFNNYCRSNKITVDRY